MTFVLKLAGGLLLLKKLVEDYATGIFSKIEYRFLPLKKSDFKIRIEDNTIKVVVYPKMVVTNNNSFGVSINKMNVTLSRAGEKLGTVVTNNPIEFTPQEEKQLAFEAVLDSQDLVQQIDNLLKGKSTVMTPIDIRGKLYLSNGTVVPIIYQLKPEEF